MLLHDVVYDSGDSETLLLQDEKWAMLHSAGPASQSQTMLPAEAIPSHLAHLDLNDEEVAQLVILRSVTPSKIR